MRREVAWLCVVIAAIAVWWVLVGAHPAWGQECGGNPCPCGECVDGETCTGQGCGWNCGKWGCDGPTGCSSLCEDASGQCTGATDCQCPKSSGPGCGCWEKCDRVSGDPCDPNGCVCQCDGDNDCGSTSCQCKGLLHPCDYGGDEPDGIGCDRLYCEGQPSCDDVCSVVNNYQCQAAQCTNVCSHMFYFCTCGTICGNATPDCQGPSLEGCGCCNEPGASQCTQCAPGCRLQRYRECMDSIWCSSRCDCCKRCGG